ncbi:exopolygalacturonase [Mucilaginibacter daejeonensis]|uniref:glycoside hydrolase family 28 protein n=1 Tax=Mucilaginibacter daejeonensis TaxID=398049 RepID=UPI001D17ACB6|nr:glycosyl hydrolase family 28 protein [Mucilaginibacter daejeonensis]UEG54160.1 exopolygalacturonase [Mucilaginibacter daejeonensis]
MKGLLFKISLLITPLLTNVQSKVKPEAMRTEHASAVVGAPRYYDISRSGAVGDGKTMNTKSIQALIDKCAKAGGGTLLIPKGVFLSGALFLKPGVNIEMRDGAVLKGSTNIEDYPKILTRIEGHFEPWRAALLNGDKVDHLRITGNGTLDGSGKPFWLLFYARRDSIPGTTNLNVERPRLAFIQNSRDVKISGIRFLNSGFWNLHLYRDQNVEVTNCRFEAPGGAKPHDHAPSSDGIDVDSSQDINIIKCYFSVGDDDIALKGSKGPLAMGDHDSPPVERVTISDCVFESGGGVVTCGSEATIVRHVKVERCIARGVNVLRLKLRPDTPQQYEDITLDGITMEGNSTLLKVSPWTQYFDLKGQQPPSSTVRNISVSNVKGSCATLGEMKGTERTTFGTFTLKNIDLQVKKEAGFAGGAADKLTLVNVKVNGQPYQVK